MEFSASIEFPAAADTMAELFATEAYVRDKIAESGATHGTVEILGEWAERFTVSTRRVMPTTDIPASYRSLVGTSLEIRQVEAWEQPAPDGSRRGTIALEIHGAPVRVTGTLRLFPATDARSVEHISGDIKASIPFFGKAIERAVADSVHLALDIERRVALRWLEQR